MQRRAAAAYLVFFLVIGAIAFSVMVVAEEPGIAIEGDTYGVGDTVVVEDREYTVAELTAEESGGGGHGGGGGETTLTGSLTWTNESARHTETLENDTAVPAADVQWDGQSGRHVATIQAGDTVRFEGETRRVNVTGETSFALEAGNNSSSFEEGDDLPYRNNVTTVVAVRPSSIRLVWGTYRVQIPNETTVTDNGSNFSDPATFAFREEPNVTALLMSDPAVYNRTVVVDGTQSVVYRQNNSTVPLAAYRPAPERRTFTEGEQFTYKGTQVTVDDVTIEEVPLEWFAPRENEIGLEEGANITLNGQPYVVHFVSEHAVLLSPDRAGYQRALARQDAFHERMIGLKGVMILSGLTASLIIGLAYLPVRG